MRDLIDAQSFLWVKAKQIEPLAAPPVSPKEAEPGLSVAEIAAELAARAFWEPDRADRLVRVAQRSKQLLLYGPPGTGKTYVALILARLLAGEQEEGQVRLAQFHPSYAYDGAEY